MLPAEQGDQQTPGYSQRGQHHIFSGKPVEIQVSKTAELPIIPKATGLLGSHPRPSLFRGTESNNLTKSQDSPQETVVPSQ